MPNLSYSKRFSMSRRRYWSKIQNDKVIFWCSMRHFAFDRLKTSVNEILSNLIVYSLKCTTNRHRLSYTKTLAHYLFLWVTLKLTNCLWVFASACRARRLYFYYSRVTGLWPKNLVLLRKLRHKHLLESVDLLSEGQPDPTRR